MELLLLMRKMFNYCVKYDDKPTLLASTYSNIDVFLILDLFSCIRSIAARAISINRKLKINIILSECMFPDLITFNIMP